MAKPNSQATSAAPSKSLRSEQNSRRRQAANAAFIEFKKANQPKVARGTARAKRRAAAAASGLKGESFSDIWMQFKAAEKQAPAASN